MWKSLKLAALGCTLAGCDTKFVPRVWVEDAQVIELTGLDIETLAATTSHGAIRIRPAEESDELILLTVTIRAGATDDDAAYALLDKVEIETPLDEDQHMQHVNWRWREPEPCHASVLVSYDIRMPSRLRTIVRTQNGDIDIAGIAGSCDAETYNGTLNIANNGVELVDKPTVRAVSHNGAIRVSADAEELTLHTHNGRIDVSTHTPRFEITSHNGEIVARLHSAGEATGKLTTHNGSAKLDVTPDLNATFECRSANGRVTLTGLEELHARGHKRRGRLGSGAGEIQVDTHNGSIELRVESIRESTKPVPAAEVRGQPANVTRAA